LSVSRYIGLSAGDVVYRSVVVEAARWRLGSTWRQSRTGFALRFARTTVDDVQRVRLRRHEDREEVRHVWRHRTDRRADWSATRYTHSQYTAYCCRRSFTLHKKWYCQTYFETLVFKWGRLHHSASKCSQWSTLRLQRGTI